MSEPNRLPGRTLRDLLVERSRGSSALHRQFLQSRARGLSDLQAVIAMQVRAAELSPADAPPPPASENRPALFTARQLDAFGTGRLSDCLGPAFARYDQRRIPRIPNGDLKMMSRITAIQGQAGRFDLPAAVTAEYDLPSDAWFLREGAGEMPFSLWMETALQPCGFLSAYLDSYALVPHEHFYFRNLDGWLRLHPSGDLRGRTIQTEARLLSSVASNGTVIQKYAFVLASGGQPVGEGESVFGYFSAESMASQAGLDGGRSVPPWLQMKGISAQAADVDLRVVNAPRQARGRMALLERALVDPHGGKHGLGYVYAERPVDPADWFYPFHFTGDPVMPGSLGVEAVLQALQGWARQASLANGMRSPRFALPKGGAPLAWKYRGQITPAHGKMSLEAHVTGVDRSGPGLTVRAEASLWVDGLRIYEIKDVAVSLAGQ